MQCYCYLSYLLLTDAVIALPPSLSLSSTVPWLQPPIHSCGVLESHICLTAIHQCAHTQDLAPIERDDISWSYIAATRLFDLTMFITIWHRETGGHKRHVDAPLLGGLLATIERLPLYLLLSHFFLLSYKTLFQVLITDIFAASSAMYVISRLEPKRPSFFPAPYDNKLDVFATDRTKLETISYGIGLSTFINALYSYISERTFLGDFIRNNVQENEIPAYLSAHKPALAEALAHPTYIIPILRSSISPLSMPEHISHALPLSILVTILSLIYLPQKSPLNIAALVGMFVLPSNALHVYNLLPINGTAAIAIALENALRASTAAYIIAWITDDWRRPLAHARAAARRGSVRGDPEVVLKDVTQADADEIYIVEKNSVTVRRTIS
jgi:hypothetical protein